MLAKNFCSKADSLIWSQCAVGVNIQGQLIVIGNLSNTGVLNRHIDTLNWCVNGINRNHTNREIFSLVLVRTYISTALCDCQFHIELTVSAAA